MRPVLVVVIVAASIGCAGRPRTEHVAPPAVQASGDGEAVGGGETSSGDHQPQIVRAGKSFKVAWADAQSRYPKGARCAGDDAPEVVIGAPDQRNEMTVAKSKVVTYGFRFAEGTLMIRCRADHVETTRTLK